MLTYLLGPVFSIFPKPWRKLFPFCASIRWEVATAVSGLAQSLGALLALAHWYSVAMTTMIDNGVSYALAGKTGPEVAPQAIGSVALVVWASHPLTWVIGYFAVEGAARFCVGAFGESSPGTLPLFLLDKILFGAFRRQPANPMDAAGSSGNLASVGGALRERMLSATLPSVPDELSFNSGGEAVHLEIRASRKKDGWTPPRVVRYEDHYYRLEAESVGAAPRPFRYVLRRLAAGVPGRSVLMYAPEKAVVLTPR